MKLLLIFPVEEKLLKLKEKKSGKSSFSLISYSKKSQPEK
ncbi:hypothetical protein N783_13385 [Pontibacillus marinus BH030004 = DSM 16465]|uniref:Uncharacterized protein n=1 Tax=Pontibacillus marinus BH030004 = DSM 16465 TaxID=1385511 RepID=A0A0A5GCV4_9BACI|nr:hypothetical protein N783_13385 [Pontibacillus marinus BH030004 = DSM 16465]